MFPATNASEHLRIHYMHPNGSTSAGFVEQRERTINARPLFFVTFNGSSTGVTEQPVDTLRQGMDIIEWLVREIGESK